MKLPIITPCYFQRRCGILRRHSESGTALGSPVFRIISYKGALRYGESKRIYLSLRRRKDGHPRGRMASGEGTGRCLQIAHGVAEYALRYEPFARFLNAHGFLVVANDHLGHGESVDEARRGSTSAKRAAGSTSWTILPLRCRTGEAYPEAAVLYHGLLHGARSSRSLPHPLSRHGQGRDPDGHGAESRRDARRRQRRSQAYWQKEGRAREPRATSWKSSPSAPNKAFAPTARATTG